MKTGCLAGCLAVSLVGMEICESKEIYFEDDRTVKMIQPMSTNTLAWNPHTHFELDTEVRATTSAHIFAFGPSSRGNVPSLHISRCIRFQTHRLSSFGGAGRNASATETELLSSKVELPTAQIENARRWAIAGSVQGIGGSHSGFAGFLPAKAQHFPKIL